jgi:hypothetical protein
VGKFRFILAGFVACAFLCPGHSVYATERRFAFTYEVTTADKGEVELENWVTWRFHRGRDGMPTTQEFAFRHELEFGLTDRLQAALYFADWRSNDHPGGNDRVHFDDAALEVIYRLSDPTTDFLGSAAYGEIRGGPDLIELEGKILLQKNFGKWTGAYNATLEGRWLGEHLDRGDGEFAQTMAVSYTINPRFTVGAEALHEIDIPNWAQAEKSVIWAGPNVSIHSGRWSATITLLAQLTDNHDEPSLQARLITGVEF